MVNIVAYIAHYWQSQRRDSHSNLHSCSDGGPCKACTHASVSVWVCVCWDRLHDIPTGGSMKSNSCPYFFHVCSSHHSSYLRFDSAHSASCCCLRLRESDFLGFLPSSLIEIWAFEFCLKFLLFIHLIFLIVKPFFFVARRRQHAYIVCNKKSQSHDGVEIDCEPKSVWLTFGCHWLARC